MIQKQILVPRRVRRPPKEGWSWIDRRFVREHAPRLSQEAILLYFFLAAVSDKDGLSFYREGTIAVRLRMTEAAVVRARDELIAADLLAQEANSPEFGKKVDQLTNMGRKEIMAAAGMSNRFLDRPVRAMDRDEGVGANLSELRRVVEDLDPGKRGKLSGTRKFLGIIPFGNKLTNYFRSYQSAQGHIQAILSNLASGKDELLMDNAAIDVERQKLWEAMGNLEQMIHISRVLDERLEEKAIELDATDPEKAKAVRETALFYVRQRTQDLLEVMELTGAATTHTFGGVQ